MDIRYAVSAGVVSIVLILRFWCISDVGSILMFAENEATMKERMFCVIAYMPKATVQAAIGGVPLCDGIVLR